MYFRQLQHLLPRAVAWRITTQKRLRQLFEGLSGWPSDVRDYADSVYDDLDPQKTREVQGWEGQFGLMIGKPIVGPSADTPENVVNRRNALSSAWRQQGGQSPLYLQTCVQAAGFPVYIHEWWTDDPPFTQAQCGNADVQCGEDRAQCSAGLISRFKRNPLDYTHQPAIGSIQCGDGDQYTMPQCTGPETAGVVQPMCNRFLMNEPGYIVNKGLNKEAPPPIPNNPDAWSYFLYFGGENFPDRASVPRARQEELERLILKLRPSQQWCVMMVDYTP